MVQNTSNHGWKKPAVGSDHDAWGQPLNDNADKLDIRVEIRDTEANLSTYDPKDGAKYLATDTGAIYLGDGSSWNQTGIGGDAGITDRRPDVLSIDSTETFMCQLRRFERFSANDIRIADGGSIHIEQSV